MRRFFIPILWFAAHLGMTACHAQKNFLGVEWASTLALETNVEIVCHLPGGRVENFPPALPVFKYSGKARLFPTAGLNLLLAQSAFAGTNLNTLLTSPTHSGLVQGKVHLAKGDFPQDEFFVDTTAGEIKLHNEPRGKPVAPKKETAPRCDEIKQRLSKIVEALGVAKNEMELDTNGAAQMVCRDTMTSAWSGVGMERVRYVSEREVEIHRGLLGFSTWLFNDKIVLRYGADDHLNSFYMSWPDIQPVATNSTLSVAEMIDKIKSGQCLTDMTDFASRGLVQIELTGLEVQYFSPRSASMDRLRSINTDMFPYVTFFAAFKFKDGQVENGGIFFPALRGTK